MSAAKIVKRYANRKLYDTERSCYVTLDDIAVMIRSGEEVTVVDNKSGEDLTSVTLAQIIFETEKKSSFMPLGLLRGIIRSLVKASVALLEARLKPFRSQPRRSAEQPISSGNRSCLLYTSPSPRDVEESRMPSSA